MRFVVLLLITVSSEGIHGAAAGKVAIQKTKQNNQMTLKLVLGTFQTIFTTGPLW